jgi:hypothetical protein
LQGRSLDKIDVAIGQIEVDADWIDIQERRATAATA